INDLDFSCLRVVEFPSQHTNPSLHEVGRSNSGQGVARGEGRGWIARGYRERRFSGVLGEI
ncbi:MAG TPA: hypothetical protein PK024_07355, partial [Methanospirillum sp.]|uniref:hypothetical protein n=1 Tax=Methanospirillum sp. TaxID=45200 RepID=UPI002B73B00C